MLAVLLGIWNISVGANGIVIVFKVETLVETVTDIDAKLLTASEWVSDRFLECHTYLWGIEGHSNDSF